MGIARLDHVAIPVGRPEAMIRFYRALGFSAPEADEWRRSGAKVFAVQFGDNKINMHAPELWQSAAFTLRGPAAQPGCGDFCFVWTGTPAALEDALAAAGAVIEEGPVERIGGRASGRAKGISRYTRDPDGNLLEFIIYPD